MSQHEAKLGCGCRIGISPGDPEAVIWISWCGVHGAAHAMLAALEDAEGVLGAVASRRDVVAEDVKGAASKALDRVRAAIVKATGEGGAA